MGVKWSCGDVEERVCEQCWWVWRECQTESRQKGNSFLQEISAKCSLILLTQTDVLGAAERDRVHHSYAPSRGQHRRHCRLEALMFAVQRPGGTAGLHRIFSLSYLVLSESLLARWHVRVWIWSPIQPPTQTTQPCSSSRHRTASQFLCWFIGILGNVTK